LAAKRWKLVVTDLGGGTAAPSEVTTEGDNWMRALANGRGLLGEPGGVPAGASCAPSADGGVTVLDPSTRRRYALTPLASDSAEAPAAPAPPAAPAAQAATPPKSKRRASKTVAYMPSPVAPEPPPNKKKFSSKTVAYVPSPPGPGAPPPGTQPAAPPAPEAPGKPATPAAVKPAAPPAPPAAPAPPAKPPATPAPPEPPPANAPEVRGELLSSRDEEPSVETPLCYRERNVAAPAGTSRGQAEQIARAWFEDLRRTEANQSAAKFFNVSVFDHRWEERPSRPALVTLQWKDWRGEPLVQFPETPPPARARRVSQPPAQSAAAVGDRRLSHAYEACQDLMFLSSPEEVLRFVARLMAELVPSEATAGFLLDPDTGVMHVVTATGVGADAVQGTQVPADIGLCGATTDDCLHVEDVSADGRFVSEREGRPGLAARNALYAPLRQHDRVVGVVQLLNRADAPGFSGADEELAAYVARTATEALA
jgi:hypothetical protein